MMKTEMHKTNNIASMLPPEDSILNALLNEGNTDSQPSRATKKGERKPSQANIILLDIINDLQKSKVFWKISTGFLLICFMTACFMGFNFYNTNKTLDRNLAEMKGVQSRLAEANIEIERLKADIYRAATELKQAQDESNAAKAELQKVQQELCKTSKELKDLQQKNAEVAKILKGRLQKLSNQTDVRR